MNRSRLSKYWILLGLLGGMLVSTTTRAQTAAWSTPLQISNTVNKSWFPDVIVDTTGRVHVVWASNEAGYDVVFYKNRSTDEKWSKQNDIFAEYVADRGLQEATRPALVMDDAGNLHMTNRVLNIFYSNAPAATAELAQSWRLPIKLSTQVTSYFSRLVIDHKGGLHAFITQSNNSPGCPGCLGLFHRASVNQGVSWSNPVDVSMFPMGVVKPQVIIDREDWLHVVWEAGVGGTLGQLTGPTRVMYSTSRDFGSTWSEPINLSQGESAITKQGKSIAIAEDGKGQLVVVWLRHPEDVPNFQVSQDAGKHGRHRRQSQMCGAVGV